MIPVTRIQLLSDALALRLFDRRREGIDPTPPSPADDGKPVADLSRFGFKPDLKKETHSGSKGRQAEEEEVVFTGTSATPKAKKGTLDGFVKKG